jgi:hypothetical protein
MKCNCDKSHPTAWTVPEIVEAKSDSEPFDRWLRQLLAGRAVGLLLIEHLNWVDG